MATIALPNTFTSGTTIQSAQVNSNFTTIYNDYNGNVTNANIAAGAAIVDTKLASISTAGKVSGAALTSLSSIPSGAGVVPIANLATGTPTGSKFIRDDGTLQTVTTAAVTGMVIQVVNVETGAVASGTTAIPYDDTIPQSGEGDQFMSLAITPSSATNKLRIDVVLNGLNASNNQLAVALFQDATAGALAVASADTTAAGLMAQCVLTHFMTSGTTSATTFKVRAGASSGTTTFNGTSAARLYGGVIASSITITEIKV